MQFEVVQEPAWKRRIQIEIPADQVSREYEETYRRVQRNAALPGFRKGKVPRSLVEKSFGPRIREEVVNRLLDEAYKNAIRETDIHPVSYPTIDKLDFELGSPMTIHAVVEVKPEVDLVDYKSLVLKPADVTVNDEDVEEALEAIRERNAQYLAVEGRLSQETDLVIVDQEATDESGLRVPKCCGTDLAVPVGHELTRPKFNEALTGVGVGDKREVRVEFTKEETDPALRGKKLDFTLVVKELKEKQLPDMDDAFAAGLGDFADLEALRAAVRLELDSQAQKHADEVIRKQAVEQLVQRNPFDLPGAMVERYLESFVESAARRYQEDPGSQGEFDPEEVRESSRPTAELLLRKMLIFEAVQRAEDLSGSDEELSERIEAIAAANNIPARKMRVSLEKEGKLGRIRDELLEEKTFRLLVDLASVEEAS